MGAGIGSWFIRTAKGWKDYSSSLRPIAKLVVAAISALLVGGIAGILLGGLSTPTRCTTGYVEYEGGVVLFCNAENYPTDFANYKRNNRVQEVTVASRIRGGSSTGYYVTFRPQ